MIQYMLLDAVI